MLGQIAFKNTLKNWRHSLSALLSLAASFISLVIFDGYMANIENLFYTQFRYRQMQGHVLIENKDMFEKQGVAEPWKYWVTKPQQDAVFEFIKNHPTQIQNSVRSLTFQGMLSDGQHSQIFLGRGYDVENGKKMRGESWKWNTTFGIPLDETPERFSTVLGQGLARDLGCHAVHTEKFLSSGGNYEPKNRPFDCPFQDVQLSTSTAAGQLNAVDVNVLGLLDCGYKDIDDRMIYTSLEAAQTLLDTQGVTYMALELDSDSSIDSVIQGFNNEVGSKFPDLHIIRWQDHPNGDVYKKTLDFLSIFRNFIIIVILVVSTLSVVNTLVKIVKERTREIGTLRSIGFRSRQVATMFLYESLYLALIGTFIGTVLSLVLTLGLNALHITYKAGMLSEPVLFTVDVAGKGYLTAAALLIVVSLLASYFSTLSILRSKIVDNLSHV
jgi:putative ABC transport system permease protein